MASSSQKDGSTVIMDAQCYEPEEVSVKVVNNFVVVDARAEEQKFEGGFFSAQIRRRFPIPENCDRDKIICSMSEDGKLIIKMPPKEVYSTGERIVEIKQTGTTEKPTPTAESKPKREAAVEATGGPREHIIKIELIGAIEPIAETPEPEPKRECSAPTEPPKPTQERSADVRETDVSKATTSTSENRTSNRYERVITKSSNERIIEIKQTGVPQRHR